MQGIYAPEMLLEITTPRVLIMEWIEGRRLRRAGKNGFGPSQAELQEDLKLVEIGVQCSLEQVCARLPCTVSALDAAAAEPAGGPADAPLQCVCQIQPIVSIKGEANKCCICLSIS